MGLGMSLGTGSWTSGLAQPGAGSPCKRQDRSHVHDHFLWECMNDPYAVTVKTSSPTSKRQTRISALICFSALIRCRPKRHAQMHCPHGVSMNKGRAYRHQNARRLLRGTHGNPKTLYIPMHYEPPPYFPMFDAPIFKEELDVLDFEICGLWLPKTSFTVL